MTDLTNLASVITDQSNIIQQAEQRIVSTLREMHSAGGQVQLYFEDDNASSVTVAVFPAGTATDDIENAVLTVDLPISYADELGYFAAA